MDNFNIKLPDDVQFIIHTLQSHGFEAYAVGGCVRDSILGREPGDWDITTSAMPEETKALFDKTSERSDIYKESEGRPAQTRLYDQCYGIQ